MIRKQINNHKKTKKKQWKKILFVAFRNTLTAAKKINKSALIFVFFAARNIY